MNIKKIIITLAFLLSLFSVSAYAKTMQFTMGDYNAKVDEGEIVTYTMEVAPYTVEGRTMVPVRIVSETFDADVKYSYEQNKVDIKLGDKAVSLIIGEDTANVGGEIVKMDVPSVETNGRTLVPLRFISETLGFDVKYVAATEQILITNDAPVYEINGSKVSLASFAAAFDMYKDEYGEGIDDKVVYDTAKLMLTNYAVYESEANKWDIPYPIEYKQDIKDMTAAISSRYPKHLDGVWADLMEIEYRATSLNSFLSLVYTPDEAVVKKYYEDNFYAAKHILVEDKTTAKNLVAKIKKGSDFDKLMAENSIDPGLATNPDGYVFTTGEMVEPFENATKELKIGKVSEPVETDFGYHIIKRIELPELDEELYKGVENVCINDTVAKHYNDVVENAEIKDDNYTAEQVLELCK